MKKRSDGLYQRKITINGKPKVFYGKTIAEINKKILAYQEVKERGRYFKDVAAEWERFYLTEVPYTTYKKCGRAMYNYALQIFGDEIITDITARDVSMYLHTLAAKGYSQKSVSTYKSILNQIFKYAIISGDVKSNPSVEVSLPKNLPKKKRNIPNTEEIRVVSTLTEGFGFLGFFLLYTGLRVSEALALTYEDIDFDKRLITVDKKIVYDGNNPILRHETKTEAGTRKVILLDVLYDKLPKQKKGLIFANSDGKYYTAKQLRCGWEKVKRENNLSITLHQLRHAYATMLFEAGINEKDAQELMGHSTITLTREIYTHIRKERMEETAQKLNAFNFLK